MFNKRYYRKTNLKIYHITPKILRDKVSIEQEIVKHKIDVSYEKEACWEVGVILKMKN